MERILPSDEHAGQAQSFVRDDVFTPEGAERVIREMKERLPEVEAAIAALEEAKKVDRSILDREITI